MTSIFAIRIAPGVLRIIPAISTLRFYPFATSRIFSPFITPIIVIETLALMTRPFGIVVEVVSPSVMLIVARRMLSMVYPFVASTRVTSHLSIPGVSRSTGAVVITPPASKKRRATIVLSVIATVFIERSGIPGKWLFFRRSSSVAEK